MHSVLKCACESDLNMLYWCTIKHKILWMLNLKMPKLRTLQYLMYECVYDDVTSFPYYIPEPLPSELVEVLPKVTLCECIMMHFALCCFLTFSVLHVCW